MQAVKTLHRAIAGSLILLLASPLALADPGNGKGQGHGKKGHDDDSAISVDLRGGSPQIDVGNIRVILGDNRGYWSPGPALPPGIQKNLARGKPLPPGIAKRLDGRLVQQLPHYEGYEWMQTGRDLILVAAATGVIYEVLNSVFD
ncbi:anti-virulence regulator CigR family protein [Pseudomonas sp. 5P_3.1_Bac2]|nr:anti-virulence regulator CigR family protein [Pseudomonas sp. 5P_3.1_Bac2]MCU1716803.1 anti-virulence regulator CigR family protein [Pseudomonas sp. 5P_3.1_Bac2]